ncbi:universal stress protein [Streptacidiphilus albus]|uniref:universal stress protein n=1 Tax=Streptacidiphilus albus TaxID=105425 RepID=UPI0005A7EA46|nr:universal stress protein [Streptacidiphilus albus]
MAEHRVVVGVSGSAASRAAFQRAAREARRRDAVLVPVLAWHPVGGEFAYRTHPCPPLLKVWEQAAQARLDAAFVESFGGYPAGLRVQPVLVRDEQPGRALVEVADRADDLLVVSTGKQGRLQRLFHGSVSRYCLAHAHCTVVAVPPSELQPAWEASARADADTTAQRALTPVAA